MSNKGSRMCDQNTESCCYLSLTGMNGKRQEFQTFKTLIYSERAGNLRRWHPSPSSSLASSLLGEKKV